MTDPPLSRFAGEDPKPRPTHTIIVPGIQAAVAVVMSLLLEREVFTVEPSLTQDGVWHLGLFQSGVDVVTAAVQAMPHWPPT